MTEKESKESQSQRTAKSSPFSAPFSVMPAELAAMGRKRMDEFVKVQTELLDKIRESNQQWFDRARAEADLTAEFASSLTAARSLPDAARSCQEWSSRRFELMAEDVKRLLADSQKFMEIGARFLPNGGLGKSGGASG